MSEEAKWYVVHTYSGYENKVATNIEKAVENRGMHELIQEVKVPTETVTEIKDNKKLRSRTQNIPGYVLIKMIMTDESWYIVRNTRGCTGFVGPSSKPIPLTKRKWRHWAWKNVRSRSTMALVIPSGSLTGRWKALPAS